jgi:5-methyltetrahydropteroyltriglutamate--homocysteine methyltransferase
VPTSQHIRTLNAARLAADIADVPTVIVARTDALAANLLTSDVDERDAQFVTGERTAEGFYRVQNGMAPVIARGLAYASYADLTLLDRLLPVYAEVLADLRAAGAEWVQLDEPALVQDRTPAELNAAARAYRDLGALTDRPKLLVASYFDRLGDALPVLAKAPVEGLALDFTDAAAANLDALAAVGGLPGKRLVAGVVNGRNIWINDLEKSLAILGTLLGLAGRVDVSASCSLLHVPLDAALERDIDPQILRWLAFARQKTAEVAALAKGLALGTDAIAGELAANRADLAARATGCGGWCAAR